jgi:hypothetical protein
MTDDLVTVGNYQFLPEAQAACLHLEAEGIRPFLSDAETVNMDWLLGNAIGLVRLQVPRSQAEAALAVLERTRARRGGQEDKPPETAEAPACLSCGAELPPGGATCASCGWSYAAGADEASEVEPPGSGGDEDEGPSPTTRGMDALRSLEAPLFLVVLTPFFVVVGVFAVALLFWLIWLILA